ncbi:ParB-like nuclease family protein [Yoonia maricola]|uniref:ParB-like nuclease family protein n=1 Tax=Yoonia maricola TaxID=420999 RepID=A0A2M8W5Y6_9RHOB|nr:ParB N-terminal domain-containing protein [Yoonia maricola]PJI86338.1 ParB-like nuclease family protein [Yoonia maricola]
MTVVAISNHSNSQQIKHLPIDALSPYANNPRTHSNQQVRQIADSIEEFGWTNPVLIDADNGIIAGHERIAAAKLLGMSDVPVMRVDHLTDAQKRAYIIADNKLAENAGWDDELLVIELQALSDLARKHANDCRALMRTGWYRRLFPKTLLQKGRSAEMDFNTTAGGERLSTSVGGTLTGRGGDIIIIDDPIKPDEALSETTRRAVLSWFSNTLSSRLNDKKRGAIVLVMQRLHEEDLAGHLLEAGGWYHLSLPAIAEVDLQIPVGRNQTHQFAEGSALHAERESVMQLEILRRSMGSANFSAQYQQSPVPVEDLHVKRDWLRYCDVQPDPITGDRIVQSWDTASKDGVFSDYSVCVTALTRKREVYILDVYRAKLQFPDLKRRVVELAVK